MSALQHPARLVRKAASELFRPGESQASGAQLWLIGRAAVTGLVVLTNLIGAIAVVLLALFVIPSPAVSNISQLKLDNTVLAFAYFLLALLAGVWVGTQRLFRVRDWLQDERPADLDDIRRVLRAPMHLFALQVALWLVGAVVFGVFNGLHSTGLGLRVAVAVAATGLVTASCAYLLTELVLRPAAARAMDRGVPQRLVVPGVATKSVLAWFLGTGIQLFGIVAIGLLALTHSPSLTTHPEHGVTALGVAMVVLGGVGLAVGLLAVVVVARTTATPLDSVRRALKEVEQGHFHVRVPVYDGTQIGQLQLGFNNMVAGLRERERIREAFGAYVDPDVADRILEEDDLHLDGEEVEVTVMFIDMRDFTGFAEDTEPKQVVQALNQLFEQMVRIIHAHGGWVDKFVGDGLLAVFGAPRRTPDHADQALATAVEIAQNVSSDAGLEFGIGLNSGRVLAGNIGGAGRLEFSVMGDPVNVAARVEAATRTTGDGILIAEHTRELLSGDHPDLEERPDVHLKGKTEEVRLFAVTSSGDAH
ncbi:MAG TPA: adenylate/guanylate cyclase domain-containing protein [Solirubrobacteraceae bacterium]|nr:adenylate/guanylate cyclase domain-containing protein [Solirubrobacteraceae bacterium]